MSVNEAYITGIGQSQIGVKLDRHPLLLTVDAVKEALAESGLTIGQIDGVSTYPGRVPQMLGFSPVGADDLIDALGIKAKWYAGGGEITSQLGAIVAAATAVKAGLARHVICFRTVYEAGATAKPDEYPMMRRDRVDGGSQWTAPFNAISAANWVAQYAMRHVKKYGLTREQLAQIALTDRAHAALNPRALVREPLTMDEYMSARLVSTPLCLFDCDRYSDASTVIIVSAGDAVDEVKCTPVRIAAMAGSVDRHSWDQAEWMASYQTGPDLWKQTDYTAKDVDTVQLYDGFSFLALTWLEALGFCDIGEGGQFIEGGHRIALDGELPFNTFGGQIGAGRLHGFGFAHEAVTQLRGLGGDRQIKGDPKVAIATSGGGPLATALLLARD
ncbi:thiolase family protein [Pseudomaricurvus sp. HS19]|uniref:thiolase family protein n=1 Tax=Pseudomaricurvus sp. HS19 TaxID=2692626 RepID=UPI00136F6D8D|nr:thiolase family protein [Pseudomaricurvus sp. HS19]MYM64041.1 thiolase family protein [Pseudomaricurvus sp. HS19]